MKTTTTHTRISLAATHALHCMAALLCCLLAGSAEARQLKVLAIGNSFSQDAVEQYLWELAAAQGDTFVIGNAYIGGCSLDRHWKNALTADSAYAYRKIVMGRKSEMQRTPLRHIVADEPWDIVTLQQASPLSGDSTSFDHLTDLMDYVRAVTDSMAQVRQQDATDLPTLPGDSTPTAPRLLWHLTWAYPQHCKTERFKTFYHGDQLVMYRAILETADSLLPRAGIDQRIPTGIAIQRARRATGDVLNRDDIHLSLVEGRYTAACTWCDLLTGRSVLGNSYRPKKLSPAMAAILQSAAHKAVVGDSLGWRDTLRVLWLGTRSSVYEAVPTMLKRLAEAQGLKLHIEQVNKRSSRPTAMLQNRRVRQLLGEGGWDYVVIQEPSPQADEVTKQIARRQYPYDRQIDTQVLATSPDARIIYFNTWGQHSDHLPQDYPLQSTGWLATRTQLQASRPHAASPALLLQQSEWAALVGDAWREVHLRRPNLPLYDTGQHRPTVAGSYLTACVLLRAMTAQPVSSTYTASLPEEVARFLQETVK